MKRFRHMHPRLAAILVDGLTVILMLLAWLFILGIGLHVWAAPAPADVRIRDGVRTEYVDADLTTIDRDELTDMRAAEEWTEPETVSSRFTDRERYLLLSIMVHEAGNQGVTGQALVGRVVLNRVQSGRFPGSVEAVLFQPGQFGPEPEICRYEPNTDSYAALELLEAGWDESQGALFFESGAGFSWATFLFQYGGHRFYV